MTLLDTVYKDAVNCCGCSLCEYVCSLNAVSMKYENGFLFPEIDNNLCVNCGKCQKLCPFLKISKNSESQTCFAAKHKDNEIRKESSSGGVFTALSDAILKRNGIIAGAVYNDQMELIHTAAESFEERDRMRGSKYIQSNCTGIYKKIKEALLQDREVLFCGTPCEVAAVKNAFPNSDKLYLADIICHGVPSPQVWRNFVEYLEKRYSNKLCDYKFRDKTQGWRTYSALARFTNGQTETNNDITGSYIELFRYDVCLRPSCTVCPYTDSFRPGDITIGDFWGIENIIPEIDDNKGVSAVICNTDKGRLLLDSVKSDLLLYECSVEDIKKRQPNLSHPSSCSNKAEAFNKDLNSMPFDKILHKYTRVGLKRKMIDFTKKVLKK